MANKKDFSNVADAFLTAPTPAQKKAKANKKDNADMAINYDETKARRVQLMFRPSTLAILKELAHEDYTSLNGLINDLCERYIEERCGK